MLVRQASFHGGEISPNLYSRTDIPNRAFALRTLRNFIPTPTGAAINRAGFQYIAATKDSSKLSRLIPFTFSTTQAYVLEFGDYYVRVWQGGAKVLDGGGVNQVEVATVYPQAALSRLQYVQSGDTLTLTHPSYAPYELKRVSATSWVIAAFSVARTAGTPTAPTFLIAPLTVADSTHAVKAWDWVVCAVVNGEEGPPSPKLSGTVQLAPDRPVTVGTASVSGAQTYNWYRGRYGVYGYIGNSTSPNFIDDGQVPNYSDQPPTQANPFAGSENPSVATYFQQRLAFANQPSFPQRVVASQVGRFHNFDYSLPQKDSDSIDFTVASRQYEEVRALVPLQQLVVLTANTEFVIDNGDSPIVPSKFNVIPVSFNGCSWVRPLVINDTILYVQSQLASVRELVFGGTQGWGGGDVSLVANHLLAASNHSVIEWAYQRIPYSVVWAVREDGALLSLTYSREFQVTAWARHDTDGAFESVCVVPEGNEDVVYAIVRRTVNAVTKRYIERMSTRQVLDKKFGNFLDCSVWYQGAPASVFGGLSFLEGKSVKVLRDGIVEGPYTVTGGTITISTAASSVFIGLSYLADIELLDLFLSRGIQAVQGEVVSAEKIISRVIWEVDRTAGLQAGEDFTSLTPWVAQLGYSMPAEGIVNDQFTVPVVSSWNRGGRAVLRQANPLPVTVIGVSRDVTMGAM